jgi:mannose-6-phosphate isomerase-like protein (cupin superfamily)
MDIRNDTNAHEVIEHGGTCTTKFLVDKEELRSQTMGGYLELVSEFSVKPGVALEPHSHDSDEFYYLLEGSAIMRVGDEEAEVTVGDLIRTPPNTVHSIRATGDDGFRALAFATSYMPADRVGYTAHPVGGEPHFVSTEGGAVEA